MLKKTLLVCGIVGGLFGKLLAQTDKGNATAKPMLGLIEGLPFMSSSKTGHSKNTDKADSAQSIKGQLTANLKQSLGVALESFLPFQFKYAILLNESVEKVTNVVLYKTIDDWFGTRYRYGGTTVRGIDCSAFMQVLSRYAFGWMLPRTAHEQYKSMASVAREELREGDFVFFNTQGGISHVGMYLQNNKFVHSSSSQGVSIGDLEDKYWKPRFIGARRVQVNSVSN